MFAAEAPGRSSAREICRNCIDGEWLSSSKLLFRGSENVLSAIGLEANEAQIFNAMVGGILGVALGLGWSLPTLAQGDPLPSWNDTPTKQAIVEFVGRVTKPGGPDFVAPAERIATFDNDGTLWVEQPMYVQMAFALDRVKAMAPLHPEWSYTEPFQSVLEGDIKALAKFGEHDLVQLIMVTHAGMTTGEFSKIVTDWLATARDPRFKRLSY